MQEIKYKGFILKSGLDGSFTVFGKSFFEPVNIVYTYGTLKQCKEYVNSFLNIYKLKSL